MPDDYFPDLKDNGQAATAGKDYFPDISDSGKVLPSSKKGGTSFDLNAAAKSFAGNILPGLAELPEQGINAYQAMARQMPQQPLFSQLLSDSLPRINQAMGQAQIPYLNATNALRNMPLPGSVFQGQTPNQLAQQQPLAAGLGSAAGQAPAFAAMGGPALEGLPWAGRVAASALGMGALNAGLSGLQEATDQAKYNDAVDAKQVGGAAYNAFGPGAILGGLFGMFSRGAKAPAIPEVPPTPPPPAKPIKLIEMKGPLVPPGPTERLQQQGERLFGHTESVQGEVLPPEPTAPKVKGKAKKQPVNITVQPVASSEAIATRVHHITTEDNSWRDWRNIKTREPLPQELKLAQGLANLEIEMDKARGKLRGAIKAVLDELGLPRPTRQHLTPEAWKILNQAQKDAGAKPGKKVAYIEATMAPGDQAPEHHNFTSKSLMGRINEIDELDRDYVRKYADYENYKEDRESRFAETMPINDVVKVKVTRDGNKVYDINIKRVWRNSAFTWDDLTEPKEITALRESLKTDYPEINTEAFVKVVQQAANRGNLPAIEQLADAGTLDWFRRFDSSTQAKIVLAIGLTASIVLANQQQAEAAPPNNLVAKVLKKLYNGSFKEWMGSGPITYATKLEMQTDMVSKGFDTASKKYFADRMAYMSALERANLGARKMTDAEKIATRGMQPWQLRRANLPGWTPKELAKAGDIADLNQRMKEITAAEVERLKNIGVDAKHIGRAERYALGVHHDAHDQGIDLGYNPQGPGAEAMNMVTGHVMEATALGNYGWVIDHAFEALMATASKYPGATKRALQGLATNDLYREFLNANSPAGFFEQMLDAGKGFEYRKKIDKWVNGRIDAAMEKYLGKNITDLIAGKLPERSKLGINGLVITLEEAKNYPGGAEQYMRDWLANAKNRQAVPAPRQLEFEKTALKIQIEKNIATGFVPEGPISEKTVFQRTGAFSIVVSYTRGKTQQSRFVASLMDDALRQAAANDWAGVAKSIRAILYAHLFLFGAAGSAFVPPYVWFALEQADRARYGTTKDVQEIREALDKAQKNVGPGYQKRELGPTGVALSGVPSGAVMSLVNSLQRDFPPKDKMGYFKLIADATTLLLLSRIGPIGNLNLRYMLKYIVQGGKGEDYVTSEKGIVSQAAAVGAKKSQILTQRHIGMTKPEGIIKALTRATTPEEVKEIQRGEKISARRLPGLIKKAEKNLVRATKR